MNSRCFGGIFSMKGIDLNPHVIHKILIWCMFYLKYTPSVETAAVFTVCVILVLMWILKMQLSMFRILAIQFRNLLCAFSLWKGLNKPASTSSARLYIHNPFSVAVCLRLPRGERAVLSVSSATGGLWHCRRSVPACLSFLLLGRQRSSTPTPCRRAAATN